jgi:hypothetical protein
MRVRESTASLMASTPSAYPQVVSGSSASFRVVDSAVSALQRDFEPGSIPGGSTENKLVKAKSLGQLSFSSRSASRLLDMSGWRVPGE